MSGDKPWNSATLVVICDLYDLGPVISSSWASVSSYMDVGNNAYLKGLLERLEAMQESTWCLTGIHNTVLTIIIGHELFHMVFLRHFMLRLKTNVLCLLSLLLKNLRLAPNLLYIIEYICITYIIF